MEFLVLPLLLLVGLVTSLDGGSDEDSDNGSGDENDVLTGSGTEHVYGHAGDDDLTPSDHAVGMGGDGDDTISAQDSAVGYGLAGDDRLTGADIATIKGGEGDDWLGAEDEALAEGGNGNDLIFTLDIASGSGGTGDDTLSALDDSSIYGGAGDDILLLDDYTIGDGGSGGDLLVSAGENLLTGRAGSDLFLADLHHPDADVPKNAMVTDYTAGEDQLAVLLGQSDTSGLTMTFGLTEDNSSTVVEITDQTDTLLARFTLEGVTEFDPASLQFYNQGLSDPVPFDGTIVPLGADYNGSGTETVTGSEGDDEITLSDEAVGHGAGGDDTLFAEDNAQAFGGAGDDTIYAANHADIHGGSGDDLIRMSGEFDGSVTAMGDAGADRFVMENLVDTMEEAYTSTGSTMKIGDFNPDEDVLGVVFDPDQLGSLEITSVYDSSAHATTVSVIQHYPSGEPPVLTVAKFELAGVTSFDPSMLQFYADDNLTPLAFEDMEGTAGHDVLSIGHPSGVQTGMGYDGNDTVTVGIGGAHGGDGDDVLHDKGNWLGRGDLYGEAGNDTISCAGDLYGGDGNDEISLGAYVQSYSSFWPDYILDGQAVGGAGDDTISGGAPEGDPDHGIGTTIAAGVQIDAGAGNDLIRYSDGLTVVAGSGDDIVIKSYGFAPSPGNDPTVTLGDGADRFFLATHEDFGGATARITDFDPAEDALGIIAPEDQMTNVTFAVTYDAALDRTTITFDNRDADNYSYYEASYVLDGVNGEANPIAIQLYNNEAAALAGIAYRTL